MWTTRWHDSSYHAHARRSLRRGRCNSLPHPLARYFDDSRTGGPDGASPSDDGGSVADEFLTITPDGRIARLDDYFTAFLGGRAAIRNSMVRGDLHSRRPSATKKPPGKAGGGVVLAAFETSLG